MTKRTIKRFQICHWCGEFYEERLDKKCPNPKCRRKQPQDYISKGGWKPKIPYKRLQCKTKNCEYSWLYKTPPKYALVCPICNKRNYWFDTSHISKDIHPTTCPSCNYSWKPRKRKYHKDWRCPICRRYMPVESLNYNPTDKQIRLAKDLGLHYDGLDRIQLYNLIKLVLNRRNNESRIQMQEM